MSSEMSAPLLPIGRIAIDTARIPRPLRCSSSNNTYMQLLDRIIEADLLCRGRQFDCLGARPTPTSKSGLDGNEDKTDNSISCTLESINLLAQSLDCRLRYRSSPSFANQPASMLRQTSEDSVAPVIFSVGFSLPNSQRTIKLDDQNPKNEASDLQDDRMALVWLHVCDISATSSEVCQELIRIHSNDWCVRQGQQSDEETEYACRRQSNVLLVFEGKDPVSILFLLEHFVQRLDLDFCLTGLDYMHKLGRDRLLAKMAQRASNSQDADDSCVLLTPSNSIVVNNKLADYVRALKQQVDKLESEYRQYKSEVELEYCKFQLCTTASLSLAKRLSNLPEETSEQFTSVNKLVREYYSKLNRLLGEIDVLKSKLDRYSRVPTIGELIIKLGC